MDKQATNVKCEKCLDGVSCKLLNPYKCSGFVPAINSTFYAFLNPDAYRFDQEKHTIAS